MPGGEIPPGDSPTRAIPVASSARQKYHHAASGLRDVEQAVGSEHIAWSLAPLTLLTIRCQWLAASLPRMREASETGNHPWLGSFVVAVSATAYSTAGFFTRLIDLDIWTVLCWRGLFAGLFIAGYVGQRQPGLDPTAIRHLF